MDLVATTQILGLVRDLHERTGLTVVMVSHALNEVANYVERIALVHQGGFAVGSVAEVMTEEHLTAMYGIQVDVSSFEGHRIVVAKRARTGEHRPVA
jgi:ABC-type cobalamin/Fe3+-siderophores transport system ATPase subunit